MIVSFFLAPFIRLIEPPISQIRDFVNSQLLRRKAVEASIAFVVLVLSIGVSFVAYLVFYWIYIPQRGHVGLVHLQYDKFSSSKGHVGPSAVVDFTKGGRYTQILRGDQAYDISMKLVVPTSSSNVALGNFMVMVQLIGANGHVIITSSRPAIITYESSLLRLLRTIWRAIPLVLRWTRESQTIRLPLIESFVESSLNPVTKALIEISNPGLQIYRTTLHIDAHFQGLRYFMYYYRVTTALIFMTVFIFWEIVFCILTWQTISAWMVEPASQAIATVPRPMLYNHHDNLPPSVRHGHPQLQQHPHSPYDTDNDESEDDYLVVNNSTDSDENERRSKNTSAPATKAKSKTANTRQQLTPRRRAEQDDSDATTSDADSMFDAIVPQQQGDIGASSSIARMSSSQVRSRKAL
ncbi:Berardinelli-Seip congenital lipodystrophy 2 (seipin) [Linnemannia exigua]|uniref:Berardinelli-Seip congenital lipodystrophy 2 (Seipin) n=1 Tax=Linnemannia exigua TaxID=604196 RepID=A0AAD4H7P0_9FUNG|nr:Berardinelli-Seip congenital lipodystrophy 2 (seipin) [Linnemannia exigua]